MSIEHFSLGLLSVLLLGSNVFWAKLVFSMSNRLMSRDYFEFVQTEKMRAQKPRKATPQEDVIDPIDEAQAQQLNSIFNIV